VCEESAVSGKSDLDRAWDLVGSGQWERLEVIDVIAALLAEIRKLRRGKR
jgi:hypothetical protein